MSPYTQILYQIGFATKKHQFNTTEPGHERLYRFKSGMLQNINCHLYRINGVDYHLYTVRQTVALSTLVNDIMLGASDLIKRN